MNKLHEWPSYSTYEDHHIKTIWSSSQHLQVQIGPSSQHRSKPPSSRLCRHNEQVWKAMSFFLFIKLSSLWCFFFAWQRNCKTVPFASMRKTDRAMFVVTRVRILCSITTYPGQYNWQQTYRMLLQVSSNPQFECCSHSSKKMGFRMPLAYTLVGK